MFMEERHQAILDIIAEEGSISTAAIQQRFSVSYDSAKRDLRLLEEKGLLKRTHGGAIPKDQVAIGKPKGATARDITSVRPNYMAIAKHAAGMIRKNDVIFLTSATMGLFIAQNLPKNFNLRVATNSIVIAEELRRRDDVRVILIGGEMDDKGNCYDGFALSMINRLRFDKAFLTSAGISPEFGLSIQHSSAIPFWNAVIDASRETIGLYPTEKLGADSVISICAADRLDTLLTDDDAGEDMLAAFAEMGVAAVICEEKG